MNNIITTLLNDCLLPVEEADEENHEEDRSPHFNVLE
jgi:hypothetical protein